MIDPRQRITQRIDSIQLDRLEPETQIREQVKENHRMTAPTAGALVTTVGMLGQLPLRLNMLAVAARLNGRLIVNLATLRFHMAQFYSTTSPLGWETDLNRDQKHK